MCAEAGGESTMSRSEEESKTVDRFVDAVRKTIMAAILLMPVALVGQSTPADGARLFTAHCAMCHDLNVPPFPNRQAFKLLVPEDITQALTTGTMREQGAELSEPQRNAIAAFITAKHLAS